MHHLSSSRSPDLPGWCAATLVDGCALPQGIGRITRPPTTNCTRKATHSYQGSGYGSPNVTAIREQADMAYLSGTRLPRASRTPPGGLDTGAIGSGRRLCRRDDHLSAAPPAQRPSAGRPGTAAHCHNCSKQGCPWRLPSGRPTGRGTDPEAGPESAPGRGRQACELTQGVAVAGERILAGLGSDIWCRGAAGAPRALSRRWGQPVAHVGDLHLHGCQPGRGAGAVR